MLAGEIPYGGPNMQAMIARRMTDPVPSLRTVREQVPPHVERAIVKALAKTPADRFATATQFAESLSAVEPVSPLARAAWPGSRRATAFAAGAALLAVAIVLAVKVMSREGATLSANRVAVLPFAVRASPGLSYLAEGMVDLLSRDLDGAAELHTVDPGTILTAAAREGGTSGVDLERARLVARRLGAGLYVLGSVNAIGAQIRLQAAMYDATRSAASPEAEALQVGDSTQLFALVDRLSGQLLAKRGRGMSTRLTETAAITTHSLAALKAYLEGERRLRAASLEVPKLDSAISMFQQAVTEDSTFALAHYRMAVAAGWANRHTLSTTAATHAVTLSEHLSMRDRRLLTAYVGFRRGAADDAEQQYRAILRDYPDDLEALFQLADLQYNYNPLRGRPRGEARESFNQVLELDPGFL
jgi:serine/threonine-protein kinase